MPRFRLARPALSDLASILATSAEGWGGRRRYAAKDGVIEIIRVLHERMEPSRHLDELTRQGDA